MIFQANTGKILHCLRTSKLVQSGLAASSGQPAPPLPEGNSGPLPAVVLDDCLAHEGCPLLDERHGLACPVIRASLPSSTDSRRRSGWVLGSPWRRRSPRDQEVARWRARRLEGRTSWLAAAGCSPWRWPSGPGLRDFQQQKMPKHAKCAKLVSHRCQISGPSASPLSQLPPGSATAPVCCRTAGGCLRPPVRRFIL